MNFLQFTFLSNWIIKWVKKNKNNNKLPQNDKVFIIKFCMEKIKINISILLFDFFSI